MPGWRGYVVRAVRQGSVGGWMGACRRISVGGGASPIAGLRVCRAGSETRLRLRQTGIKTLAWLDRNPLTLAEDAGLPLPLDGATSNRVETTALGTTDQDARIQANLSRAEGQKMAAVMLRRDWHRLLVKWIMQLRQGEAWTFAARFTDPEARPVETLRTQCQVPNVAPEWHAEAMRLMPQVTLDNAPFNLLHEGEVATITVSPTAFDYELETH